jgi:predicted transcriptional regulator
MASEGEDKKEVYLEADKEIPGQHYVCMSFLSPEKVLANKDIYFFSEFLKDYEIQYKIKATEGFMMAEVNKLQEYAAKIQDVLDNLRDADRSKEDIQKAFDSVKDERANITKDITADLEAHVRANMADFKATSIQDAYETFLFKNRKKLEDDFFAKNSFRTTIRGLKIRGVYDTYPEAVGRAKTLQKIDPSFNVYVGQIGFWLPWDPEPHDVADQEYADDQLNQLMKKYKENESQRDEFYEKMKRERIGEKKTKEAGGAPIGASQDTPTDMFGGEDLAIARKKERELEAARKVASASAAN